MEMVLQIFLKETCEELQYCSTKTETIKHCGFMLIQKFLDFYKSYIANVPYNFVQRCMKN